MVLENLDYVKKIAKNIHRRCPNGNQELEDMIGDGMIGLVKAALKYKGEGQFMTYARYRITGEIIDGIRKCGYYQTNRRTREKGSRHCIKECDLSEKEKDIYDQQSIVESDIIHSIYQSERSKQCKDWISSLSSELDKREIDLLQFHWGKNMTLKKLGMLWGVNESRACQIKKKTIKKLRSIISINS